MSEKTPEQVGGDKHYDNMQYEPIEIIEEMGSEFLRGFCLGNVIKYKMRAPYKNGEEDLKKAEWYRNYWVNYQKRNGRQTWKELY